MKRAVAVFLVVLLASSLPAFVAAGAASDGSGSTAESSQSTLDDTAAMTTADTASSGEDVLHRTTTLRHLSDQPGEFETEIEFEVPSPIVGFEIDLGERAALEEADGFETAGEGTYRWTEETDEPSIRVRMPANQTGEVGHIPEPVQFHDLSDGGEGYTFVDTGEWGIVQVPGISISARQTAEVGFEEEVVVDGPGATGGEIAFFGAVAEHERTTDGETIRLIVPEAAEADLADDPEIIVDLLGWASERLDVGARSEEVFVVAVPPTVDWGPQGVQVGDGNAWVVADSPLESPANVWLHEYVHTRQGYVDPETVGTTDETRWLVEAQAEYYAATLAFEKGLIEFEEFAHFLEGGERSPYADGTLAQPDTWSHDRTDYVKGRLVYGEIDRGLRLATDGDRTAADVFRVLNAGEGRLTGASYLELLEVAGGEEVRSIAEEYTETDATPEMWSQQAHGEAFDLQGATIEYDLGAEALTAAGESWPVVTDDDGGRVVAVPVDESVSVPVAARNVGDREGTADPTLEIDGRVVDYAQPELAAGDRTTENLTWTPSEPGTFDLRVGDERVTVFVGSSASVTVTELSIAPETVAPGDPLTVTATIENEGENPVAAILSVETPEGSVGAQSVSLESGETTTITEELRFDDDGEYEVAVGEQTGVAVVDSSPLAELDSIPGFGLVTAVVAVAVVVGAGAIGRRWI